MSETFIPILEKFNQYLMQREEVIDKKDKEKRMRILSSNFINELQKATTTQEIAKVTLQTNKISALTGIPELASLVNNYARIKQGEVDAKSELESNQASAKARYEMLKDQPLMTVKDGQTVISTYGENERFKQISLAPEQIQAQLYKDFDMDNALKVEQNIIETGKNEYGFSKSYIDKDGKSLTFARFAPMVDPKTGDTYYDDEYTEDDPNTPGVIENLEKENEPGYLSEFKMRLHLDEKARRESRSGAGDDAVLINIKDGAGGNKQVYVVKTPKGYKNVDTGDIIKADAINLNDDLLTREEYKIFAFYNQGNDTVGSEIRSMAKEGDTGYLPGQGMFSTDDPFYDIVKNKFPGLLKKDPKINDLKLTYDDLIKIYDEIPAEDRSDLQKKFIDSYEAKILQYKSLKRKLGIAEEVQGPDPNNPFDSRNYQEE